MSDVANSTDSTPKKQKFLIALTEGFSVTGAAKTAKIDRKTAYNWKLDDSEFAEAWGAAIEAGNDALEDEAVRRAKSGVLKPVFQGGKKVGSVREYSNTLLIFLLKARRPEKYRERFDVNLADKSNAELLAIATQGGIGGAGAPPVSTPGDAGGDGKNGDEA